MKKTKLFLTFALIGLFQMAFAQQDTLTVSGQLTNTNGAAIPILLSVNDGGNWITANSTTDANGDYSAIFVVSISQGIIDMYFHDCIGDTIDATQSFNPGAMNVVFPTMNYCTPAVTGCQAYFDINQATTQSGNAVAGTLVVTDSSFGSSAVANLTYTWSFGDGNSGTGAQLTHTYAGNGPYVLCLTINDGLGCTDTFCDTVSVDSNGTIIEAEGFDLVIGEYNAPLSISDNDLSSSVNVFPNPATDFINVEFNSNGSVLNSVKMFDLSGKLIHQEDMNGSELNIVTVNTQNIEPGTYLVQMSFNNKLVNQKVIIK
ncbi:MAG: PKD domain-containing protein [Crocinitomicaceae bacterium]